MTTLTESVDRHRVARLHRSWAVLASRIRSDGGWRRLVVGYQLWAGIVVALFWLRSGLAHITNPYYFLSSIYSYEILGPVPGVVAAMGLPALQLILAAGLVTRRFVGGALFLSALLLGVFVAAQVSALRADCKSAAVASARRSASQSAVKAWQLRRCY